MNEAEDGHKHAYYTLSGDVNSDMVQRVFEAVAAMTREQIDCAHILLQSNGGYVSDGLCLYNYLSNLPIEFHMYNGGAVASIAVTVFLAGRHRFASETARFMVHKSHATATHASRPETLRIIVEGLRADDARTERILRRHLQLSDEHWAVHEHADLHLAAEEARQVQLIEDVADFCPPKDMVLTNI
ncbi:ATP-dependent Clp protease proteolytic subunit [Massilia sp. TS11]|uniref:ATP-dependent Clp protease proteolytic subunit n=1 Tax=Massilia sp. TS11 TaxID=2908003 RepID=UPI001EDA5858|nr:ATP-dependent Clp protease proteolytic subunit [Massilia sp. TS11]MCG2584066.1 ATP-dependent Clp protease proteolytic subunit [Massilia sp. TS11]